MSILNFMKRFAFEPKLWDVAYGGNLVEVERLLEAGADVNAQDNNSDTAISNGINNISIVKLLINAGADVNAQNNGGNKGSHIR